MPQKAVIGVQIHGLDELHKRFSKSKEILNEELEIALRRSVQRVQSDVKRETPVDTGRLRGSITSEVTGSGKSLKGIVGTNVKYAPYVEFGTRPHFPPLSALEVWARRHGTTAWNVAIGIARKGTKAREMFKKGLDTNMGWVQKEFEAVADRVVKRLAD